MYFWVSCAAAGLCVTLLLRFCLGPAMVRPTRHVTPAHWLSRVVWPWILTLSVPCGAFIPWRLRQTLERTVGMAGLDPSIWLPERVIAAQCLACLAGILVSWTAMSTYGVAESLTAIYPSVVVGAVCCLWPRLMLREHAVRRQRKMLREFPFLVDMTTLCVEAGLNLHGALELAARNIPDGPLRQELRHALADIRAGVPRLEALEGMADRTGLAALRQWVTALTQADRLGMSLGPLLRAQSEQHRAERFLRAEKLALEAPVKMLFPLVVCIFPCTFLVIGFPIALKLSDAVL